MPADTVHVKLPEDVLEVLKARAEAEYRSVSNYCALLIQRALEAERKTDERVNNARKLRAARG